MVKSPRTSVNNLKPKIENCDEKSDSKNYKPNESSNIIDNNSQIEELSSPTVNKVTYWILIELPTLINRNIFCIT